MNVIFDFGNVLYRWDPYVLTACCEQEHTRQVADAVFGGPHWPKLDQGTISYEDAWAQIWPRLPEELRGSARAVYEGWPLNQSELPGVRALIRDLKKAGNGIYLLSNISEYFIEKYPECGSIASLFEMFDGFVFSSQIKIVKPNPEIYRFLLRKYGLKAEECIFIDDVEANVRAAETLGIQGILADGNAARLRAALRAAE